MEANELRIGNYVDTPNGIKRVSDISVDRECWFLSDLVKPIPLTEEWFYKLGFIDFEDKIEEIKYYAYRDFVIEKEFFCFGYAEPIVFDLIRFNRNNPLKYVHQLQNLYFALTGEELTIKH